MFLKWPTFQTWSFRKFGVDQKIASDFPKCPGFVSGGLRRFMFSKNDPGKYAKTHIRRRSGIVFLGSCWWTWKNWVFHKNLSFFDFFNGFRGFGGFQEDRTDRPTCKVSADLVVHGIGKSTFQHFPVNWHFSVPEMALKTLHFVQGLSRTPLLFIPRYLTNVFFKNILQKQKSPESTIWKSENPKTQVH